MKIEIDRKYLTLDVDTVSEGIKENIISNSGYSYLDEFILAYITVDGNIVFIDKDYLVESITKAKLGLEFYDDDYSTLSEDSVPYIGRELLVTMGEPNGTFFYSLIDEVWNILREQFDSKYLTLKEFTSILVQPTELVSVKYIEYCKPYFKTERELISHFTKEWKTVATKEYKVILDVLVDTTELVPVLVEAKDEAEAKQLAIKKYEANPLDFEPGLSDGREVYVNLNSISEWKVEEVK